MSVNTYTGYVPDTQTLGFAYFDSQGNPNFSYTNNYSSYFLTAVPQSGIVPFYQKDSWNHLYGALLSCLWQKMLGPPNPNAVSSITTASNAGVITIA